MSGRLFLNYFFSIALTLGVGFLVAVAFWHGGALVADQFWAGAPSATHNLAQVGTSLSTSTVATVLPVATGSVPVSNGRLWPVASGTAEIVLVGDIMLDRGVKQSILANGHGDYNFPFAQVSNLKEVDVLFANLEGPISARGVEVGNTYSFRMATVTAPVLATAGFDVLSVANNHIADWGRQAFDDTLVYLKQAGLSATGGGLDLKSAREPAIIVRQGLRLGFLAFSDVGPGAIAVSQKQSGILIADTERIRRLVKSAHAKTDFLIVSYHFGNEYQATSTLRQKTLAHLAIDSGADAVVGSHPHVVQELETYHGKPIAYSLGNFVFDQYFSTSTMAGGVWHLLVSRHQVLDSKLQMANLNVAYQPSVH